MPEMKYKRKKNVKYRGSHTHGGGSKKKRRGAGHRGGRGNAGSGKKADQKKQTYIVMGRPVGRNGFVNPTTVNIRAINVGEIQRLLNSQIESKQIKEQPEYTVDLESMKFQKLLANGDLSMKLKIKVRYASASAIEKVKAAGGSVELLAAPKVKKNKTEQAEE